MRTSLHASYTPAQTPVYAHRAERDLKLHIYRPEQAPNPAQPTPAILLFFGGGWKHGGPEYFAGHGHEFAKNGLIAISADYRTEENAGTSPLESIQDARTAMRYLKTHAQELGIDPNRIITGGGSVGGLLALGTVLFDSINHEDDDLSIDPAPDSLVLFNPICDTSPSGYGHDRVKPYWKTISPLEQDLSSLPATLILSGTEDSYVPVKTLLAFQRKAEAADSLCDLCLYSGQSHGFFFYQDGNNPYFHKTAQATLLFITSKTNH